MIICEWQGRHGDRITRLRKPPLGRYLVIYEEEVDDRKEHFPDPADFPAWDPKRKIADLPDPPTETR